MQNHGSSGELLNVNDSGTSFTAGAEQITSKITSKFSLRAASIQLDMQSTRFVDLLAYVLSATEDHNSFKCLYSAKRY